MKYTTTIKVSAHEIYMVFIESVIAETKKVTGKDITESDLKGGYKYKRKMQKKNKFYDVTTHIKEPVLDKEIHITASYPDNNYRMDYIIEKKEEFLTTITYAQNNDKGLNEDKLSDFLFSLKMKKRFKEAEKYIINARKQKENESEENENAK